MGSTKHVVLFPFPAQGHLAGFLEVAHLLRRALPDNDDVAVTVISTPCNVAALRASANSSSISFHALPFVPEDHGLPADCESTSSLSLPAFITLFEAFESSSLERAFDGFISGLVAENETACVIADVFVSWTVGVARRRGCAHAFFLSCGAFGTAILHALWKNMPALPFGPDGLLCLPEYPEVEIHRSQLSRAFLLADGVDRWTAYHHRQMPYAYRTDAMLINTVEEFEPTGLAMLRRTLGKVPVWPIGPLVRDGSETDPSAGDGAVMRWLDSQPPSSVLYISFGSQNSISPNQMMELATALEFIGRPFVWAIRPPVGFDVDVEFRDEWLPEGFEARTRAMNRGLLVHRWAPQVRILAHGSTGAFLSHCGWNSVVESLARGMPIVGWPVAAEQFHNVKILAEEWGVCVEVAWGNLESSAVESSKVAEVVEMVMGDTADAAEMRRRVREVQELLNRARAEDGGSSTTALHDAARVLGSHAAAMNALHFPVLCTRGI